MTHGACYALEGVVDFPDLVRQSLTAALDALKATYPQLGDAWPAPSKAALWGDQSAEPRGARVEVCTFEDDVLCIRVAQCLEEGFAAIELQDLGAGDRWECFFTPSHTPGEAAPRMVTGWRRAGPHSSIEPPAWLHAVAPMALGEAFESANTPDLMSLVAAAMAGNADLSVRSDHGRCALLLEQIHDMQEVHRTQAALIRSLRAALEAAVTKPGGADSGDDNSVSENTSAGAQNLEGLGDWAAANIDRIVVLPRAIKQAAKSNYDNPALVYDTLELLADTYRLMRLGRIPRDHYRERTLELGVSFGGSVEPSNAGEEYFVPWGGRRRFLELSIGRGNSRDPRHCLRIYFFWCEETERVVVGSLPKHLDTSAT